MAARKKVTKKVSKSPGRSGRESGKTEIGARSDFENQVEPNSAGCAYGESGVQPRPRKRR